MITYAIRQPYANWLLSNKISIEIMRKKTNYRGNVCICSTSKNVGGLQENALCGVVELCEVKHVSELTAEEWQLTRTKRINRSYIKSGYAWIFRNPKKAIEMPIKIKKGIWNVNVNENEIIFYPQILKL